MKKIVVLAAIAIGCCAQSAYAIDYCKVYICMAHPETSAFEKIPSCANEVAAAFSVAKVRGEWGKCSSSADENQVKVEDWSQEHNKYGDLVANHGTANVYVNGEIKKRYPF